MGMLLAVLDTTIVATMLYDISNEFGSLTLLPWVVVAYTLTYAGKQESPLHQRPVVQSFVRDVFSKPC